ncbi:DUF1963 domain-containing protein [Halomicronema sp. CCY15110]|uniref:DUF1963 domain-containing protein n=1 Tax=Halomicronema sp. CCY15110 TaxID=2767773 RepID=UPI00194EF385|nr:DUF1963 domain-containing protein [Halomicronema sp. CCY15110]
MSIDASSNRPHSETVYLELSDGQSHKFYEVTVAQAEVTIRYGRIGTSGQLSSTAYETTEKAQAEATKKINEKLRKGYVQVSSGDDRPISSEQLLTDPRHYWVYGSAWFAADGQGGWEEVNEETRRQSQSWRFRETTRTEEYVELYDQSRRVKVRLTAVAMLVRWDRDGTDARWEEYHKGQWQEPSRDRPASESPTDSEISLSQEPTSPPVAAPPLPAIDPTIPVPSIELLNQSPLYPPRVARNLLPAVKHQLGFSFRELQYCNYSIPLPRSLTCIQMVGTFHDLACGGFTIRLSANQGRETVYIYGFDFQPNQRQMMQWSAVGSVKREERLELPSAIASGQIFHYVLVLTPARDIVFYLNNQPFSYPLEPSGPPDTLHLNYDTTGLHLQQFRVLGAPTVEKQISRSSPAVVTPVPPPDQRPPVPQATTDMPPFLVDLPSQFEPLRSFLQQNLVPYVQIQVGEKVGNMDYYDRGPGDPLTVWRSKIGGNPYFPKTAEYPIDPGTGKAMPLVMQINCAEVPPIAGFDFPQAGILQFYLGFEPADASATPGKYRVLYFPEISTNPSDLMTDFSFIESETTIREFYPEVYPIAFSPSRDLFWESRYGEEFSRPEELKQLCRTFDEWLWDYLHDSETRIRGNKLGGYVDLHADTDEIAASTNGRLLLELGYPDSDESFLFFIPDEQLSDRNFSEVEFYHVCD